eukprot:tig00000383_g24663.t1
MGRRRHRPRLRKADARTQLVILSVLAVWLAVLPGAWAGCRAAQEIEPCMAAPITDSTASRKAGTNGSPSRLYKFSIVGTSSRTLTISLCNAYTNFDALLELYSACPYPTPGMVTNTSVSSIRPLYANQQSRCELSPRYPELAGISLEPGTYFLVVQGAPKPSSASAGLAFSGTFGLMISGVCPASCDDQIDSINTCEGVPVAAATYGWPSTTLSQSVLPAYLVQFQVDTVSTIMISTCFNITTFDTKLRIFSDCPLSTESVEPEHVVEATDRGSCGGEFGTVVRFSMQPGTFFLSVEKSGGNSSAVFGLQISGGCALSSGEAKTANLTPDAVRLVRLRTSLVKPRARHMHRAALVGGKVWVFGGVTDGLAGYPIVWDDLWSYDLDSRQWYQTQKVAGQLWPTPRYMFSMAACGAQLWVYGGFTGQAPDLWFESFSGFYVFDTTSKQWTQVTARGSLPGPRTGATLNCLAVPIAPSSATPGQSLSAPKVTANGKYQLFLFGGTDSDIVTHSELYRFDAEFGSWAVLRPSGPAPSAREFHSATINNGRLFVFAGRDASRTPLNDVYMLNLRSDGFLWVQFPAVGAMPVARYLTFYIFGGIEVLPTESALGPGAPFPNATALATSGHEVDSDELIVFQLNDDSAAYPEVAAPVDPWIATLPGIATASSLAAAGAATLVAGLTFAGWLGFKRRRRRQRATAIARLAGADPERGLGSGKRISDERAAPVELELPSPASSAARDALEPIAARAGTESDGTPGRKEWSAAAAAVADGAEVAFPPPPEDFMKAFMNYEAIVGEGACGRVYEVSFRGKRRAVKQIALLNAEEAAYECRGAMLQKNIRHPNIVPVEAVYRDRQHLYLVMPPATCSLADAIERGALAGHLERVLLYTTHLARGLFHLHHGITEPVCHRDLKPGNVLLYAEHPSLARAAAAFRSREANLEAESGIVKLCDFGRARHAAQVTSVAGTLVYMPPEVCLGNYDPPKADVWGFGVVVVEMCSGQGPYGAMFARDRVASGLPFSREQLAAVPAPLLAIVSRCLDANPAARPTFAQILPAVELVAQSIAPAGGSPHRPLHAAFETPLEIDTTRGPAAALLPSAAPGSDACGSPSTVSTASSAGVRDALPAQHAPLSLPDNEGYAALERPATPRAPDCPANPPLDGDTAFAPEAPAQPAAEAAAEAGEAAEGPESSEQPVDFEQRSLQAGGIILRMSPDSEVHSAPNTSRQSANQYVRFSVDGHIESS